MPASTVPPSEPATDDLSQQVQKQVDELTKDLSLGATLMAVELAYQLNMQEKRKSPLSLNSRRSLLQWAALDEVATEKSKALVSSKLPLMVGSEHAADSD